MSMLVWSLTEWFFFFLIIYSCDRKLQFSFTISWGCSHIFCTFMNYLALFMEPVFSSFVLLIILHKQSHTNIEKSNLASYSIKCLNYWMLFFLPQYFLSISHKRQKPDSMWRLQREIYWKPDLQTSMCFWSRPNQTTFYHLALAFSLNSNDVSSLFHN